LLSN
jgi:hypothetical protein